MDFSLTPLSDHAIVIELGTEIHPDIHQKIQAITALLDASHLEWLIEYIPSFTSVTVFYDLVVAAKLSERDIQPYDFVYQQLQKLLMNSLPPVNERSRIIQIPVCYDEQFGPDLPFVAAHNNLTREEVINIHCSGRYIVYMIGFAPGFPYLGGMSKTISAPRKSVPRLQIPAGTVGIAGTQTGIYPLETPGGWQLIGRTPIPLFQPMKQPPSLLRAGNRIHFTPITAEQFHEMEKNYDYSC